MARRTGETNDPVQRLRGKKSVFGCRCACVCACVCLSASAVTEGGDVGGLVAPSLLCAGPFSSAACKNSRCKPRCVLPPSACCSNLTSRQGADGTRAWLRGFDSKLSGPKGNGDTLQLVSTSWDCAAYWPAASAGPLDLEFGCRCLGIAPSLPISPAANGVMRMVCLYRHKGAERTHKHALATCESAYASPSSTSSRTRADFRSPHSCCSQPS